MSAAGEAVDVTDIADEAGGSGRADAVEVLQAAAGRVDEFGQFLVRRFDLLVAAGQFADQLGGQLAAGAPDDVPRADGGQQGAGLRRGQVLLSPAGDQLQQQGVQADEGLGASLAQSA